MDRDFYTKEDRDSMYDRPRRSKKSRGKVDRKNEINLESSDTFKLSSRDQNMGDNTPTDSMVMPALQKKITAQERRSIKGRYNTYDHKPVEESSYVQEDFKNADRERYFDPKRERGGHAKTDLTVPDEEEWEVKTTSKGFLYFKLKGTDDCQWEFPRVYDQQKGKYKSVFLRNWVKMRNAKTNAALWKNTETGMTQTVNPKAETYIFESAMVNNIAFLELYYKYGGNINLFDNKRRTPLHHA